MMESRDALPQLLERRAAESPDHEFLRDVRGVGRTYAQFHDQALRWAAAFRNHGVTAGDNVVTMLPNSELCLLAWIGLSWLRAVEAPINHAYKGPMLRYVIDLLDARVVVIAEQFLPALAEVADELPGVELVIVPDAGGPLPRIGKTTLTGDQFLGGMEPASVLEGPGPWDLACILLTSGTTGPSKGVMVPWGELYYSFIDVPMPELQPDDGWYSPWPPFHVTGKLHFYMPVHFNLRHVLRDVFSTAAFWDDVRAHDVRYTAFVSPMAQMLLAQPVRPDDADNPLEYVSIVPMIEQHAEFARRFGVLLATGFGMSEIGVITVTDEYTVEDWRSCGRTRLGSAGYEIRVVDDKDRPVAPGEIGELIVRTSEPWALNLGYYGMPDKTIEAWRNGWFHTGDAFRVDADGNFY
jgi:crotonobetaine/carnitine-CoA ligase